MQMSADSAAVAQMLAWTMEGRLAPEVDVLAMLERAISVLRQHTSWCEWGERLSLPLQSAAILGELLEKKGDTDGACEAYGRVLARWGNAKPRSVTGDAVRKRWVALACEGRPKHDAGTP